MLPGKYDDVCTALRHELKARAVVLLVVDGVAGNGFSVQQVARGVAPDGSVELIDVPESLRMMAARIEQANAAGHPHVVTEEPA